MVTLYGGFEIKEVHDQGIKTFQVELPNGAIERYSLASLHKEIDYWLETNF